MAVIEAAEELLHARLDSPLGPLVAVGSHRGLALLAYGGTREKEQLGRASRMLDGSLAKATTQLDPVAEQLDEYFAGRRRTFDLALDWRLASTFARGVLSKAARVPYGGRTSYGRLAAEMGRPTAARAVGTALGSNPLVIVVPCHRVVRAGGAMGGYTTGVSKKEFLLALESRQAA